MALTLPPREKGEAFEKRHVLLVLEQRAMQFRQRRGPVAPQVLGRQILGQKQLEPVQHLGGGGLFLQPLLIADLVELRQCTGQKLGF